LLIGNWPHPPRARMAPFENPTSGGLSGAVFFR
jgi:hypothetical protein